MITLIVARDKNGAIGRDGTIPWDVPADLAAFQRETTGGAIIMGRRTWESLPVKPLPRRLNIVVTSHPGLGEECAGSIEHAAAIARKSGYCRLYGIGGAGIYRAMMPYAQRMLITEVDLSVETPDTFFPNFNLEQWYIGEERILQSSGPVCIMREYIRRGEPASLPSVKP